MRFALAAAAAALGLAAFGAASAQEWSDPSGRVKFVQPASWTTNQQLGDSPSDAYTYVITGDASNECHITAQANPGTAAASAEAVRTANADGNRFTDQVWTAIANSRANIFPDNSAAVLSREVNADHAWPVQRADIQTGTRTVYAGMQMRPGTDILVFCMSYQGEDLATIDLFEEMIGRIGHPNDGAFLAAVQSAEAARQAASSAVQQASQQQQASTAPPTQPAAPHEETSEERRERRRAWAAEMRQRRGQ